MAIISIRKYLKMLGPETEADLRHVIQLLLQGIEAHAVEGDRVDYDQFRSGVHQLASQLTESAAASEYLVVTGAVLKSLRDYNERTSRYIHAQGSELQHIVSMLTGTIVTIAAGNERTISRLQEIEKQIERASVIEDVRALRLRLAQCLETIREEVEDHKTHDSAAVGNLKQHLEESQGRVRSMLSASAVDVVTGLPARGAAEAALTEATQSRQPFFAVAIVVNRMQLINQRFGYAVGDKLLRCVREQFRTGLSAQDKGFRWSGPSFLLLLERPGMIEDVRREISRITTSRIEELVEIGNRSILLPVSSSWSVFPMSNSARLLIGKIDQFVASQAPVE